MSTREHLVEAIKQFLSVASSPGTEGRVSATELGFQVCNSPNLVRRLFQGHDVTTTTYDKTIDYMERWYEKHGFYEEVEDEELV